MVPITWTPTIPTKKPSFSPLCTRSIRGSLQQPWMCTVHVKKAEPPMAPFVSWNGKVQRNWGSLRNQLW